MNTQTHPEKKVGKLSNTLNSSETLKLARQLAEQLKTSLIEAKAENIENYDLAKAEKNYYTDIVLIATANSTLHLKALGARVHSTLKMQNNFTPLNGHKRPQQEERWIVIDCGSIIIHLFMKEDRDYYALDQKIVAEIEGKPENNLEIPPTFMLSPQDFHSDEKG